MFPKIIPKKSKLTFNFTWKSLVFFFPSFLIEKSLYNFFDFQKSGEFYKRNPFKIFSEKKSTLKFCLTETGEGGRGTGFSPSDGTPDLAKNQLTGVPPLQKWRFWNFNWLRVTGGVPRPLISADFFLDSKSLYKPQSNNKLFLLV